MDMEDIACGDKLVTNDGSFQEVLRYNDTVENKIYSQVLFS